MNGQALPYTETVAAGITQTVNSGFVTITPQGEWSLALTWTRVVDGQSTPLPEVILGTWTASGSTLTLLSLDPPTDLSATVSGDLLTFSRNGKTYAFKR